MSEQTKNLLGGNYNPDVLECLANLSNDEVFTPPKVVNQMLDMLPPETWSNPNLKFLDPACKTGVFLREIAKRLIVGLEEQISDLQQRLDHIFHSQLYGIAITELTALASRRSLYCSRYANGKYSVSKFDNPDGNIRFVPIKHTWENGKCKYCGASASQYQRADDLETHAYEFIHTNNPEEIFGMKFDVIIGNPPYHMSDGGNGSSAKPIYQLFIDNAKKLRPNYLSMIIPSKWYAGGKGLDKFREDMLNDNQISKLVDYVNAKDCFPGISIGGGVCYFLKDYNYHGLCEYISYHNGKKSKSERRLNEFSVFVRYDEALSIIDKIKKQNEQCFSKVISSRNPFGLSSNERGNSKNGDIKLFSSGGTGFISRGNIRQGISMLPEYKIMISKVTAEHAGEPDKNGMFSVLSTTRLLRPNEVCTDSYLVAFPTNDEIEARNCLSYMRTKFFRFLLLQSVTSINLSKEKFQFIPLQDFSDKISDEKLYKQYALSHEEIDCIESMIKPMEDK